MKHIDPFKLFATIVFVGCIVVTALFIIAMVIMTLSGNQIGVIGVTVAGIIWTPLASYAIPVAYKAMKDLDN